MSAWVNGKEILISEQKGRIKKLEKLIPGDMVYVRFYISGEQLLCTDKIEIYSEDISVLAKHVREIREKATEVYKEKGTKIRIQCVAKEDDCYLVCTVPYDDGWHIKVNGKAAESVNITHLLAIPLTEGEHEIELKYWPEGLTLGICISIIAIGIVMICMMKQRMLYRSNKIVVKE